MTLSYFHSYHSISCLKKLPLVCIFLLVTAAPVKASLQLASWNIANLAESGVEYRGYKRSQADLAQIATKIQSLNADVIALQEVTSVAVAREILGDHYHAQFESRCHPVQREGSTDPCAERDIYTVIAYHERIKSRVKRRFQLPRLAIEHTSECGDEPRLVRGAPGLVIEEDGKPETWIISVHFKASCKDNSKENQSLNPDLADDCAVNASQFNELVEWVKENPEPRIIVAGDFNRKLLKNGDNRYADIRKANRPFNIYPEVDAVCFKSDYLKNMRNSWREFDKVANGVDDGAFVQVYTPGSNKGIDHFLTFAAAVDDSSYNSPVPIPTYLHARYEPPKSAFLKNCEGDPKYFDKKRLLVFAESYPSDHCPILLEIE